MTTSPLPSSGRRMWLWTTSFRGLHNEDLVNDAPTVRQADRRMIFAKTRKLLVRSQSTRHCSADKTKLCHTKMPLSPESSEHTVSTCASEDDSSLLLSPARNAHSTVCPQDPHVVWVEEGTTLRYVQLNLQGPCPPPIPHCFTRVHATESSSYEDHPFFRMSRTTQERTQTERTKTAVPQTERTKTAVPQTERTKTAVPQTSTKTASPKPRRRRSMPLLDSPSPPKPRKSTAGRSSHRHSSPRRRLAAY